MKDGRALRIAVSSETCDRPSALFRDAGYLPFRRYREDPWLAMLLHHHHRIHFDGVVKCSHVSLPIVVMGSLEGDLVLFAKHDYRRGILPVRRKKLADSQLARCFG